MNPQDPLANLHPLRQPELIGWWPLAPGWWLLLLLIVIATATLVYLLYRRYSRNAYRRRALKQLQALHLQHQTDGDSRRFLVRTNALLKSVALRAYPRSDVASQHGANWRQFLNQSLPPPMQLPSSFDDAGYQKDFPEIDLSQVHSAAQLWIKKHRGAR